METWTIFRIPTGSSSDPADAHRFIALMGDEKDDECGSTQKCRILEQIQLRFYNIYIEMKNPTANELDTYRIVGINTE